LSERKLLQKDYLQKIGKVNRFFSAISCFGGVIAHSVNSQTDFISYHPIMAVPNSFASPEIWLALRPRHDGRMGGSSLIVSESELDGVE
jgi:hypothetical protein